MRLLRTIAVTFAQYSRIPVPRFDWEKEDMRYSMSVFPWVGAVIGACFVLVYRLSGTLGLPQLAVIALLTAVPLVITGGFHVDGFLDVEDALSSWRSREDKLAILKDPHIGAFAVIRFALLGLIWLASLAVLVPGGASGGDPFLALGLGFFLSRALSAWTVLNFRPAKQDGMLAAEASSASERGALRTNQALTTVWIMSAAGGMCRADLRTGLAVLAAQFLTLIWYNHFTSREFGGITGDTAGYFVTVSECAMFAAAAVVSLL